jgi:hypothetical protein
LKLLASSQIPKPNSYQPSDGLESMSSQHLVKINAAALTAAAANSHQRVSAAGSAQAGACIKVFMHA